MGCFSCFGSRKDVGYKNDHQVNVSQARDISTAPPAHDVYNGDKQAPVLADANQKAEAYTGENGNNSAIAFTFRELALATKNFRQECLIGEGGVGRVFKGTLQSSGQIVAVRQLDRSGTQGSKEFQAEASALSLLSHPNLVKLIGYCADGEQRLLVYEYMPLGSLRNRLFDISGNERPLDWSTRVKIASAIAQGLEYLHEKANPPVIYRDLKSSSILLDEANNPRLSEYGLGKLYQSGNKMNVSAYGYCAPEYERHGELTLKSDVYSFGVVLLELITGRKAFDAERPTVEQNLVGWAQQFFRDPKRFPDMADPSLERQFPITSLNQVVGVASMCLHEEPSVRPFISDVVAALSFLAMAPPEAPVPNRLAPMLSSRVAVDNQDGYNDAQEDTRPPWRQPRGNNEYEEHEERDFKYGESSASSDDQDSNWSIGSQSRKKRYEYDDDSDSEEESSNS